jgi:microcystin-dependent protein
MSTPYVGECRLVGFSFAPAGWSICNGSVIAISQYAPLFQLIGTTYGGDGQQNFALPNLQSRVPVHQGPGMVLGQVGGTESVTLSTQQMPTHNHPLLATTSPASKNQVSGNVVGVAQTQVYNAISPAPSSAMNPNAITQTGGSQPHDNRQPYLVLNWIIALFGVFPSQS